MTAQQESTLGTTVLAAYLNAAMEADIMARMDYLLTYGIVWTPVGDGSSIHDGASTQAATVR